MIRVTRGHIFHSLKSTFFECYFFTLSSFFFLFSFFLLSFFFLLPFLPFLSCNFFGMFLKSNHSQLFCKERNSFRECSLLRVFFRRHFFKEVSSGEEIEASQEEDEDEIFRRIFLSGENFSLCLMMCNHG